MAMSGELRKMKPYPQDPHHGQPALYRGDLVGSMKQLKKPGRQHDLSSKPTIPQSAKKKSRIIRAKIQKKKKNQIKEARRGWDIYSQNMEASSLNITVEYYSAIWRKRRRDVHVRDVPRSHGTWAWVQTGDVKRHTTSPEVLDSSSRGRDEPCKYNTTCGIGANSIPPLVHLLVVFIIEW